MLCWNWKTALFSAFLRALLFAAVALRAGTPAVFKVVLVELAVTAVAAGFQGALTQALRGIEPPWRATLVCTLAVALVNHPAEYLFHTLARTPHTAIGIAVSLVYTIFATQFCLYAMRAGVFLSGEGRSFAEDVRRLPALLAGLWVSAAPRRGAD